MKRKVLFFMCFIAVVGISLTSCNNDSEENRAVVTVASINGNAPYASDVLEQGDTLIVEGSSPPVYYTIDDYVGEDYVEVIFQNQPYSPILLTGPNLPLSDFLVTRYRVDWRRVDGGTGVPPAYEGATSISVKSKEMAIGYILLLPGDQKNSPLLSPLQYSAGEYLMIADITFWGHEIGAQGREWSFNASLSVNFFDWVIATKDKLLQ